MLGFSFSRRTASIAAFAAGVIGTVVLLRRIRTIVRRVASLENENLSLMAPQPTITDYTGKVVLVTGASSGIGAAIALLLAQRGAIVAVHYSGNEGGALATVAACASSGSSASYAFGADFCVDDIACTAEKLVTAVVARFGRLDILVNNAGVFEDLPFSSDVSVATYMAYWCRLMRINVDAAAALGLVSAQQMIRQRDGDVASGAAIGSIIMIGSRGGVRATPGITFEGLAMADSCFLDEKIHKSYPFNSAHLSHRPSFVGSLQSGPTVRPRPPCTAWAGAWRSPWGSAWTSGILLGLSRTKRVAAPCPAGTGSSSRLSRPASSRLTAWQTK